MKEYKVIFFDWDGTAVINRTAPTDQVLRRMVKVLEQQVKLVIISGTTYENIAGGKLHELIPGQFLQNLYLGLGRGALNYGFDAKGNVEVLCNKIPDSLQRIKIHEICFDIHKYLLEKYHYETDIVFSRPNYCKIDLLVALDRKGKLFLQAGEIDMVNEELQKHGYINGIRGLMDYSEKLGKDEGIDIKATTDAKYLEVGITTKSDNVNVLINEVLSKGEINIEECCFWGDEFTYLGEGIQGSDAYMITEKTKNADFFDVSEQPKSLPKQVVHVGGGTEKFLQFLDYQLRIG